MPGPTHGLLSSLPRRALDRLRESALVDFLREDWMRLALGIALAALLAMSLPPPGDPSLTGTAAPTEAVAAPPAE